jgi:hypothetical protein
MLPAGLRMMFFGDRFVQCIEKLILPAGLQQLHFGAGYSRSLDRLMAHTPHLRVFKGNSTYTI